MDDVPRLAGGDIEINEVTLPLLAADGTPCGEGRAPGVHLSEVVRHYMIVGMGKPWAGEMDAEAKLLAQLGFAWEIVCERYNRHKGIVARYQATFERDGIHMTPDGLIFDPHPTIDQYKLTKKSLKKLADFRNEFEYWLMMDKAYARAASFEYGVAFDRIRYLIMFVMGDYGKTCSTAVREVIVPVTGEELEENWGVILRARDDLLKKREEESRG